MYNRDSEPVRGGGTLPQPGGDIEADVRIESDDDEGLEAYGNVDPSVHCLSHFLFGVRS